MDTLGLQQQIDSLKLRLVDFENLNVKMDSILKGQELSEINFKLNETANIINNVDSFYDSAWLKLVILITVIGIVVPIVIQYFQRKGNKEIFDTYTRDFEVKLNTEIGLIEEKNKKKINELTDNYNLEIEKLNKLFENQINEVDGNTFYLQGRVRISENNYVYALPDFIYSAQKYLKNENVARAKVQLDFIEICIKKMKEKSKFEKSLKVKDTDWELFLAKFCTSENRDDYKEKIEKIREAYSNLI